MEMVGGEACLQTLISFPLDETVQIWNTFVLKQQIIIEVCEYICLTEADEWSNMCLEWKRLNVSKSGITMKCEIVF
jgi:hypothetical protein